MCGEVQVSWTSPLSRGLPCASFEPLILFLLPKWPHSRKCAHGPGTLSFLVLESVLLLKNKGGHQKSHEKLQTVIASMSKDLSWSRRKTLRNVSSPFVGVGICKIRSFMSQPICCGKTCAQIGSAQFFSREYLTPLC